MRYIFSGVMIMLVFASCESEYTRLVKRELEKEQRLDSILFDLNFGDPRSRFYQRCLELNRQTLVTQGPSNSSVQYIFQDSLFHEEPTPMRLLFYPEFDVEDKLSGMNMEFSYMAWAPWNRELQSDYLQPKVIEMIESWYNGNKFIETEVRGANLKVKVDGNRRVLVYIKDTQTVVVKVQDLLHPQFKHSISSK
ncbi:hypothetical protein [Fulvivirga lutimaris]|uniref:hypothetical protein n=1 Tax=Fulvivirga lutimaris TaxID=1819566 RepID=UPI0012BC7463|nr:hypothetical protein [Fulvivirga lutimaris]MTI39604.1 hypothetical protein [Fulvivirga lutimaris]